MRGRTPASHMRARRTMWWTLPFLLFFFLLALFAFLLFQRTSHSLSGAGSVPASAIHVEPHAYIFNYDGDTEPDRATSSQQEQQQQKIDSPPAEEAAPPDTAVAPPPPVEATPSPEVAKEQHSAPLHGVEEDHKRRVLVVASADDLEATLASEKADRLALADRSDQGTPLEKHLVEVGREPSGRDKGAILGVYRQCRTPDNAEAKLTVYFCNEKADPEHWARCVVNAWNVQQLVGTSIPPVKTIAASVEPSAWGMALLEVLFPGVGFTVAPSPEKCVNVDQSALQLWRAEDSAVPQGFWSSEVASAFKRLFYDRVQRPPHMQLPDQVTLLVQKNAVIVNELGLANLLSQVTGMQVVVVDLDQLSVWDQIRLMSNTGILVGMHGPGFVNSIFLPRGAVVVELFGGRYYNSMYSVLAASSGATTLAYHEPDIASVTASLEDQASELMVSSSFQATAQKALQAWRDNNQLHYRAIKKA